MWKYSSFYHRTLWNWKYLSENQIWILELCNCPVNTKSILCTDLSLKLWHLSLKNRQKSWKWMLACVVLNQFYVSRISKAPPSEELRFKWHKNYFWEPIFRHSHYILSQWLWFMKRVPIIYTNSYNFDLKMKWTIQKFWREGATVFFVHYSNLPMYLAILGEHFMIAVASEGIWFEWFLNFSRPKESSEKF